MTCDHQTQIDNHEERLTAVEKRQDAQGSKLDEISRDIAAVRAEGNARAVTATHGMDQLRHDLQSLAMQIAENTGAQKRQVEIQEQQLITAQTRLAQMKYWGCVFGIIFAAAGALGGALLSSQTWDDYLFGHVGFLHHRVVTMQ